MKKSRGRKPKHNSEEHWGKRLASVLKEQDLSNRAVAEKANIPSTVLSSWVRHGASPADLLMVKRLADVLKIDFCWLLTGERMKETPVHASELFKEVPYFDGLARIRIDRLIPRNSKEE